MCVSQLVCDPYLLVDLLFEILTFDIYVSMNLASVVSVLNCAMSAVTHILLTSCSNSVIN